MNKKEEYIAWATKYYTIEKLVLFIKGVGPSLIDVVNLPAFNAIKDLFHSWESFQSGRKKRFCSVRLEKFPEWKKLSLSEQDMLLFYEFCSHFFRDGKPADQKDPKDEL